MPIKERQSIDAELSPPFTVMEPDERSTPLVFCSPHSGRTYPRALLDATRLDPLTLRKSEDCYVDDLFEGVTKFGAPLLSAKFPRAYLDVNREPYELDPQLFGEALPSYANARSLRVSGGLGTVARIVADGEEIYAPQSRPSLAAAMVRIETLHIPFHRTLSELLLATQKMFGTAILLDCHSMPSAAMTPSNAPRPDFVIGDRFGASSDAHFTYLIRDTIKHLGYHVLLNRPYAGGYITEHYGQPATGVHAIQIEINRALYLDETTLEPKPGFTALKTDLMLMCERLIRELPDVAPRRAAAE